MVERTEPGPSRALLVLARVRQWLAVALLAFGAVKTGAAQVELLSTANLAYAFDPAPLFYAAGALGLALRAFWARYLAICFAAAITAIRFLWYQGSDASRYGGLLAGLAFMAILSGPTMRRLFDERAGKMNRWAEALDGRVKRLRILFVAQAVVLGLIFAGRFALPAFALPVVVVGGLALAGLVLLQTWGALLMAPAIGLEAYLALQSADIVRPAEAPAAWIHTAVLLVACGVSLVVLAPLLRAFAVRMRRAAPPA